MIFQISSDSFGKESFFIYVCRNFNSNDMSSYIITVNERMTPGKSLMEFLKSLSKTTNFVDIALQKEHPANGMDEAIDDIKNGRITTYENFEEYQKGMCKILGDV